MAWNTYLELFSAVNNAKRENGLHWEYPKNQKDFLFFNNKFYKKGFFNYSMCSSLTVTILLLGLSQRVAGLLIVWL